MQTILDDSLIRDENIKVRYGAFWPRVGAYLVDAIVLTPISFGLTYFNITSWKSTGIMLLVAFVSVAYKPFMEFYYGATLGKMASNLKVTNQQFERANLQEILIRNIFFIVPTLLSAFLSLDMYSDAEFESVSGYMEFVELSKQYRTSQFVSYISGLVIIVDCIMLGTDDRKRSLHDRMAGTFVIEK
jgi:uncharacterized RDD family membrane protein YckC